MKILKSKKFKVFCWNVFNGLIAIIIPYLSWLPYESLAIIIPIIILISKELHKNYNPNYWKDENIQK